jgi:hypothetical protein
LLLEAAAGFASEEEITERIVATWDSMAARAARMEDMFMVLEDILLSRALLLRGGEG